MSCKWTYLAHERRWDPAYFRRIGLGELADEGFVRIGSEVVDVASPLGSGLTAEAAGDLGLDPGIPVGAALIDAHAGGLGTVGAAASPKEPVSVESRIAYVFGTSACIMATTREATFVPGIWGPYFSADGPGPVARTKPGSRQRVPHSISSSRSIPRPARRPGRPASPAGRCSRFSRTWRSPTTAMR